MKKFDAAANAYRNPKFYSLVAASVGMLLFEEPESQPVYLSPDAENLLLGRGLRHVLSQSRTVSVEEFHRIFDSGAIERCVKERDAWQKKTYGFKTTKALYENMDCCMISVSEGEIGILPTKREPPYGASATADDMRNIIYVACSVSDAELGEALREGFNRCTS